MADSDIYTSVFIIYALNYLLTPSKVRIRSELYFVDCTITGCDTGIVADKDDLEDHISIFELHGGIIKNNNVAV